VVNRQRSEASHSPPSSTEVNKTGDVRTETRSRNDYCRGKAKSITYSECVSIALVIQRAERMLRIILPSVIYPALPNFSTLSPNRHDFREKVTIYKMFV